MNEFSLIKNYFDKQPAAEQTLVGIGDDAAVIKVPNGHTLAITVDTLVADVHFYQETLPFDLGYKSLAVNLSDLAAMGAQPACFTLALTLPKVNEKWLQAYCDGLFALANRYQTTLVGGDLTHGPLSITIQAMGYLPFDQHLLRSGAKPHDLIYVTGTLGLAGLALQFLKNQIDLPEDLQDACLLKLNRPEPRVKAGLALLAYASAAIDISDGLAADLGHVLTQSQVGAVIYADQLPLATTLSQILPSRDAIQLALTAGDDYELCFTIAPEHKAIVEKQLTQIDCPFTCIGMITANTAFEIRYTDGNLYDGATQGYQHF